MFFHAHRLYINIYIKSRYIVYTMAISVAHTLPIKGFESIKQIEELNKEMYQIKNFASFFFFLLFLLLISSIIINNNTRE